jgi:hypothetical protein
MSDRNEKVIQVEGGTLTTRDDGTASFETTTASGELHADGSASVKTPSGTLETGEEGVRFNMTTPVKSIAIENIVDLQSHTIEHGATATSHHIVFCDGGEFRVAYRLRDGRLLEFRGTSLTVNISNDGDVTIGSKKDYGETPQHN